MSKPVRRGPHRDRSLARLARHLTLACPLVLTAQLALPPAVEATTGPDVTVFQLTDISNYGAVNGVRAYAIGTTSCNIGSVPVNWCDNSGGCSGLTSRQHPVIAQNLYRLKSGRFEQIGMSWLKHGFVSTNSGSGGQCQGNGGQNCTQPPRGGNELGIGCIDTYGAGLNGSRPMGLRSEVNATTGFFPFPYTNVPTTNVIDQRMQVDEDDLNPALNPGATYWAEGQYISDNDALANNAFNNASYAPITVGAGPTYNLTLGSTVREKFAIQRWPLSDAAVALMNVSYTLRPTLQRFMVARKVTNPTAGVWHYEIAVHNVNSDLDMGGLTLDFPGAATITNVGFHDIEHHSGEPYSTTDWTPTVDNANGRVSWRTEAFTSNQNANALRWGTMFTFWFDVTTSSPPQAMIELFKPDTAADIAGLAFNFPAAVSGNLVTRRPSDQATEVKVTYVRGPLE